MSHHDPLHVLIGVAAVGAIGALVIAHRGSSAGGSTVAAGGTAAIVPAWDATSSPPPMNQPNNRYIWYNAQAMQPQGFVPGAGPACNCPASSGGDEGNG